MSSEVRDRRLAFELEELQRLAEESSLIRFLANDEYQPDQYYVEFHCNGLMQKDRITDRHVVHIYLHAEYPRKPPAIQFTTPIFHPNIKAFLDDDQQISRFAQDLGGLQNLENLFNRDPAVRELFYARICLNVLEELNWTPAITLYDICLELGAMIQFQRFNVEDPFNKEAAEWARWARTQPGLLPIDSRDLRDRAQVESARGVGQVNVRILKVEKVAP